MSIQSLIKAFEAVGVSYKIEDKPFGFVRGDTVGMFMMDISRKFDKSARSEFFRVYPGAPTNLIHVAGTSKEWGQLVLTVKEEEREFEEELGGWAEMQIAKVGLNAWIKSREELTKSKMRGRIVKKDGVHVLINKTSPRTRHFLLGRDERQLFMAELQKPCTSVKEAHDSMKAVEVSFADYKGKVVRQGEWFFIPAEKEIERLLNNYSKKGGAIVTHQKANIGEFAGRRAGKPHIAQELITTGPTLLQHGFPAQLRNEVWVRGTVSHPDHKTIKLMSWHRVIKNREREAATGRSFAGSTWID